MTKHVAYTLAGILLLASVLGTGLFVIERIEHDKADKREQRRIDRESERPLRMIFDNRLQALAYRYKPCVVELLWWPDGSVTLADTNGRRIESCAGHGGK